MKLKAFGLIVIAWAVTSSAAFAQTMNADDLKWVNQCIRDNAGGAAAPVIRAYCICMNEKMDDNETRSISVWEKSHPAERRECDRVSGWK
jgi:hypothetical protein